MTFVQAEIISVGTELLLGQIVNSNAQFLAEEFAALGINLYFQTTVGDNKERIQQALRIAATRADLIVLTGGLGPTEDDLTKEALADFLQLPLEIHPEELQKLQCLFQQKNLPWTPNNAKQAAFLPGAAILKNHHGTAPGMALRHGKKGYLVLPGPPSELKEMYVHYALPWIKAEFPEEVKARLYSKVLKFTGITESALEEVLADFFREQKAITLGLYAKPGEIQLRISAKAESNAAFQTKIAGLLDRIKERTVGFLFGEDRQDMKEVVAGLLLQRKLTVGSAESCTGGMLAAQFTDIPGSSAYFLGSVVAYDNRVKADLLGVPSPMLAEFGAVSPQVARAMAEGVRKRLGSDLGIGITGIAGPEGGTAEKPVGLVYIALAGPEGTCCQQCFFTGNRDGIRRRSVLRAQYMLWRYLNNYTNEDAQTDTPD